MGERERERERQREREEGGREGENLQSCCERGDGLKLQVTSKAFLLVSTKTVTWLPSMIGDSLTKKTCSGTEEKTQVIFASKEDK